MLTFINELWKTEENRWFSSAKKCNSQGNGCGKLEFLIITKLKLHNPMKPTEGENKNSNFSPLERPRK